MRSKLFAKCDQLVSLIGVFHSIARRNGESYVLLKRVWFRDNSEACDHLWFSVKDPNVWEKVEYGTRILIHARIKTYWKLNGTMCAGVRGFPDYEIFEYKKFNKVKVGDLI